MPTVQWIEAENNLSFSELTEMLAKLRVSVLPDFYLDRIISVQSLTTLFKQANAKALAGGGNLRGYAQTEIRGGNATNLGYALATLSVRTRLFCIGDDFARAATAIRPRCLEVRVFDGRPGFTASLEVPFEGRMVNIMISDVGDLAHFDGHKLTGADSSALKQSNCIALVNWSANETGNELAKRVFSLTHRRSRLNFIDPADLAGAEERILPLKKIIDAGLIDVISLNENEARILTRSIGVGTLPRKYSPEDVLRASAHLHETFAVTVDIHTPIGSASSGENHLVWAPAPGFVKGFVTGAGDVWDAGDVIGHLLRFSADYRLRFANACAYVYLSCGRTRLPTLRDVIHFLEKAETN